MSKKHTLPENIRRYKQEYLRLGVQEAKLNQQLYQMKRRIKLLAEEEQLRLSEKALLSELLQRVHEQKTELENQPASKKRDAQLKRVIKEYKQAKAKHSRNQYQLDKLEVKKDNNNVVKLLLKEARLEDVRIRLKSTYETWMKLEQMEQYEAVTIEMYLLLSGLCNQIAREQTHRQLHTDRRDAKKRAQPRGVVRLNSVAVRESVCVAPVFDRPAELGKRNTREPQVLHKPHYSQ